MKDIFFTLIILISLTSCNSSEELDCEALSMKTFRGFPRDAHKFKENCQNKNIYYTQALCKKALNKLILSATEKDLKAEFGGRVMECFNESDIEKFLRK